MINMKTLAAFLVLMLAGANAVVIADTGTFSDQYFKLRATGKIKKGEGLDNATSKPYAVNNENVKIETNCVLRIHNYSAANKTYDTVVVCEGKNGVWETTDNRSANLSELADGSIANSWFWFKMNTLDATVWTGTAWHGTDEFYIEYDGVGKFTAKKDKSGAVKSVKFNKSVGFLWANDKRGVQSIQAIVRSGLNASYVKKDKVDANAMACFTAFDVNAANINPPCDPR
jgi:hypothetical protein